MSRPSGVDPRSLAARVSQGRDLRRLRETKAISAAELSRFVGTKETFFKSVERGAIALPRDRLPSVAEGMATTVEHIGYLYRFLPEGEWPEVDEAVLARAYEALRLVMKGTVDADG